MNGDPGQLSISDCGIGGRECRTTITAMNSNTTNAIMTPTELAAATDISGVEKVLVAVNVVVCEVVVERLDGKEVVELLLWDTTAFDSTGIVVVTVEITSTIVDESLCRVEVGEIIIDVGASLQAVTGLPVSCTNTGV